MTTDGSNRPLPNKTVAESQVIQARQMMPDDANPWGHVHGGAVMKLVDEAAGSAAMRHARSRVATVAIDYMSFLHPVYVGDLVTVKASVNAVGRTSMEVGVRVEAENMMTGETWHTSSAYVVMVALDESSRPIFVPPLLAETAQQRRRQSAAEIRRLQRKALEAELKRHAEIESDPEVVPQELLSHAAE